jgi:hypothetical protein
MGDGMKSQPEKPADLAEYTDAQYLEAKLKNDLNLEDEYYSLKRPRPPLSDWLRRKGR